MNVFIAYCSAYCGKFLIAHNPFPGYSILSLALQFADWFYNWKYLCILPLALQFSDWFYNWKNLSSILIYNYKISQWYQIYKNKIKIKNEFILLQAIFCPIDDVLFSNVSHILEI